MVQRTMRKAQTQGPAGDFAGAGGGGKGGKSFLPVEIEANPDAPGLA